MRRNHNFDLSLFWFVVTVCSRTEQMSFASSFIILSEGRQNCDEDHWKQILSQVTSDYTTVQNISDSHWQVTNCCTPPQALLFSEGATNARHVIIAKHNLLRSFLKQETIDVGVNRVQKHLNMRVVLRNSQKCQGQLIFRIKLGGSKTRMKKIV